MISENTMFLKLYLALINRSYQQFVLNKKADSFLTLLCKISHSNEFDLPHSIL